MQELIQKYADGFTNCTMMAIQFYPREIIDIGYQIVVNGGSYPDAKMAMENAIRAEMMAGGEREAEIMEIVRVMGEKSLACVEDVTDS